MWQFSLRGLLIITALIAISLALFRIHPYLPFLAVVPATFGRRAVRIYRMYAPTTLRPLWFVVACLAALLYEPLLLAIAYFAMILICIPISIAESVFGSGLPISPLIPITIWTGVYLALHYCAIPIFEVRLAPPAFRDQAENLEQENKYNKEY